YNKVDLLGEQHARIERDENGRPWRVWVSALTGAGIAELMTALCELLGGELIETLLELQPQQGRLRAKLYNQGVVKHETLAEDGNLQLSLRLPKDDFVRLLREEGLDPEPLLQALRA